MKKATDFLWTLTWSSVLLYMIFGVAILALMATVAFLSWDTEPFGVFTYTHLRILIVASIACGFMFTIDKTGGRRYWDHGA